MSPTRRMLLKSLVGVAAAAVVGTSGAVVPVVDAAPDLGRYAVIETISGISVLFIDRDPSAAGEFNQRMHVVKYADGSGLLTFTSLRTTKARSMRLDPTHAAAFFGIFREEDNKR